ncbi:MAG TPA: lipopolysaccharide biosynthesis protein [Mycobacteriales bacterium]|nr:lipopolysaccharide biosynthesis protein [Mycobacteriales bacterium]
MREQEPPEFGSAVSLQVRATKGVLWSLIQTAGTRISALATLAVLAQVLRPADFGVVAYATVFLSFVSIFQEQGLSLAIVQRRDLQREHLDSAFWVGTLVSTGLAAVVVVTAPWLAGPLHEPQLAGVLRALSLSLVITAVGAVPAALLQKSLRIQTLTVVSVIATLTASGLSIGLALNGFGVWALVAQALTASATSTLLLWIVSDYRPAWRVSTRHFRELIGFGVSMLALDVLNFANRRLDDLLVGIVLGPVALGYYSLAYRLLLLLTDLLVGTVSSVAMPVIAEIQEDLSKVRSAFYRATRAVAVVGFPGFLALVVIAQPAVSVLYGSTWTPAVSVIRVLMFIGLLHAVLYQFNPVFNGMGRPGITVRLTAVNAIGNVIAFVIAVHWGYVAVAVAYVCRGYLLAPLYLWAGRRTFDLDVTTWLQQWWRALLAAAIAAGATVVPVVLLPARLGLALGLVTLTVGYVGVLTLVDRPAVSEMLAHGRVALRPAA